MAKPMYVPDNIVNHAKHVEFQEFKHFKNSNTALDAQELKKIQDYKKSILGGKQTFSYNNKPLKSVTYIFSDQSTYLNKIKKNPTLFDDRIVKIRYVDFGSNGQVFLNK